MEPYCPAPWRVNRVRNSVYRTPPKKVLSARVIYSSQNLRTGSIPTTSIQTQMTMLATCTPTPTGTNTASMMVLTSFAKNSTMMPGRSTSTRAIFFIKFFISISIGIPSFSGDDNAASSPLGEQTAAFQYDLLLTQRTVRIKVCQTYGEVACTKVNDLRGSGQND